jgi:hypothetical protein
MKQLISQTAQPVNQSEYQTGLMDGTRYRADGHLELLSKYENGSADYRMGWEASAESPPAMDPGYAS